MRYLTGIGSIFYGGEEYVHPGGRKSEAQLAELWAEQLSRKNVSLSQIIDHACTYWKAGERGLEPRFVRDFDAPATPEASDEL